MKPTRANRFRSQFSVTLEFSDRGVTTATLYDDHGESLHSTTSDDMDEAVTLTVYALDKLVDEYEAERDAEDEDEGNGSSDRKNGAPESQFLYRI